MRKVCGKCKQDKEPSEYHKNKKSSDGLNHWCKSCVKTYQQELRATKPKKGRPTGPRTDRNRRFREDGVEVKKCTQCGYEKTLDNFYVRSQYGSLYSHCKECHAIFAADAHKKSGPRKNEAERAVAARERWKRQGFKYNMQAKATKYGISVEEATRLSTSPCEMCGSEDSGVEGASMFIDHNHTTGKVRGGLCRRCNFYVGWRENHQELEVAYDQYAKKYGRRYE